MATYTSDQIFSPEKYGLEMCSHCNGYGSSLKDPIGVNTCTKCGGSGLQPKYEEHDVVSLMVNVQREGHIIKAGTRGTIVHFYNDRIALAVEFPKGVVVTINPLEVELCPTK